MNDFLAGAFGGLISITSIYPTEYLKYRLQIEKKSNIKEIFINTYKNYGLMGYYKGWSIACINVIFRTGIQNGMYSNIKKLTDDKLKYNKLISGIGTGITTAIINTPINNLITKGVFNHIIKDGNKNIIADYLEIQKLGYKYFWKGLNAAIYKDMLSATLLFAGYDILQQKINNSLLSGGIAGMITAAINNPLDVIQSRLQTNYNNHYKSFLDTCIKLYKEEGIAIFYKGSLIRILRPIPGRAIMFYSIELYKNRFC